MKKKLRTWVSIIFWRILRRSRVFRYWYEDHMNKIVLDLELTSIPGESEMITEKYRKKLEYIRAKGF